MLEQDLICDLGEVVRELVHATIDKNRDMNADEIREVVYATEHAFLDAMNRIRDRQEARATEEGYDRLGGGWIG